MLSRQREEAIKRLSSIEFHPNVLKEYLKDDVIYKSEGPGILYWLDGDEKIMIKDWEDETGNLVYHVIFSPTTIGDMYSFLYISKHEDEWTMDRQDLAGGYPLVYVMNVDNDVNSEYGSIGIKEQWGGLIRTA